MTRRSVSLPPALERNVRLLQANLLTTLDRDVSFTQALNAALAAAFAAPHAPGFGILDAPARGGHMASCRSLGVAAFILVITCLPDSARGQELPESCAQGVLPGPALSLFCVPEAGRWNGELVVFAHGYVAPDEPLGFYNLVLPGGVTLLDDTYNASPAATIAALQLLEETPGRRIALLGDMLELGDMSEPEHHRVGRRAFANQQQLVWLKETA